MLEKRESIVENIVPPTKKEIDIAVIIPELTADEQRKKDEEEQREYEQELAEIREDDEQEHLLFGAFNMLKNYFKDEYLPIGEFLEIEDLDLFLEENLHS